MIDTHCHLNHPELLGNIANILSDARKTGIDKIIVPSWNEESSHTAMTLAENYPDMIYPALGVHPWFPSENGCNFADEICATKLPVAIGEIGLDKSSRNSINDQIPDFIFMIELARKYDLPVIIHARGGWEIILEILKERPVRGVMHAFSGSVEMMQEFIHSGMLISFASVITNPNYKKNKQCASAIPLHNMLIETDAPGMAVYGLPRGKGTPDNLFIVAGAMAEIRGISIQDIIMHNDVNAMSLFGIKKSML